MEAKGLEFENSNEKRIIKKSNEYILCTFQEENIINLIDPKTFATIKTFSVNKFLVFIFF